MPSVRMLALRRSRSLKSIQGAIAVYNAPEVRDGCHRPQDYFLLAERHFVICGIADR